MTYEYQCIKCDLTFDVAKSHKEMDTNEFCEQCGAPADRVKFPRNVYFSGTSVEHAEYNPGLGQVVKNKYHREELAKRKNLVEVGNDYKTGESMQTKFDTAREEKLKKRYEDI